MIILHVAVFRLEQENLEFQDPFKIQPKLVIVQPNKTSQLLKMPIYSRPFKAGFAISAFYIFLLCLPLILTPFNRQSRYGPIFVPR